MQDVSKVHHDNKLLRDEYLNTVKGISKLSKFCLLTAKNWRRKNVTRSCPCIWTARNVRFMSPYFHHNNNLLRSKYNPTENHTSYLSFSPPIQFLAQFFSTHKGRVTLTNRMNFRKSSKRLLTPPHFRKVTLRFSWQNCDKSAYVHMDALLCII